MTPTHPGDVVRIEVVEELGLNICRLGMTLPRCRLANARSRGALYPLYQRA